jgi:hypothetical protein
VRPDQIAFAWLASGIRMADWTVHSGELSARIDDDAQRERAVEIAACIAGNATINERVVTVQL